MTGPEAEFNKQARFLQIKMRSIEPHARKQNKVLDQLVRPRSHGLNQMILLYVLHLRRPYHVRMHMVQQQAEHHAHLLGVNVAK